MRKALMLSAMLSLPLCACGAKIVTTPPAACSKLIPAAWTDGVEGEPIPAAVASDFGSPLAVAMETARRYAAAYVAQTGQLAKANGRQADTVTIFAGCEDLVNQARR